MVLAVKEQISRYREHKYQRYPGKQFSIALKYTEARTRVLAVIERQYAFYYGYDPVAVMVFHF